MTPTELITILAPTVAILPADCALAVNTCINALLSHTTDKTAAASGSSGPRAKPDPIYAAKGQQYVTRWRNKVVRALANGPLKRDDLRNTVKEGHGKCLPPAVFSHLLHALWAKGVIESLERLEDDESMSIVWRLCPTDEDEDDDDVTESLETPKETKKRTVLNTTEAVTDWVWEYLGQFPQQRHDRTAVKEAMIAAGIPEFLTTGDKSKNVGFIFGQEKVMTFFAKDRTGDNDINLLMRVVDEDGQPIKRDANADIIS